MKKMMFAAVAAMEVVVSAGDGGDPGERGVRTVRERKGLGLSAMVMTHILPQDFL